MTELKDSVSEQRRKVIALAVVLALLTGALFAPSIAFKFINFDDVSYITENHHVKKGLTVQSVWWALTTHHTGYWHPLTWITHLIDAELFGMNAGGHHAGNVVLHSINSGLLLFMLWRMTGSIGRSAFVAAVFALHPLHVESVAWVSERKDVLSTMLSFVTILMYVRYVEKPDAKRYAAMLGVFALALMAKPMAVTLPALLLVLDFWPLKRFHWLSRDVVTEVTMPRQIFARLVVEKIPLLVLSGVVALLAIHGQQEVRTLASLSSYPLSLRLKNVVFSYGLYLWKMLVPTKLAVFYPYPDEIPAWQWGVSAVVLIAITVVTLINMRRRPYLLAGWLWYLGLLVPVIGLVQVGNQARADRYTYVSMIGVLIMVAWSVPVLDAARRKIIGVIAAIVLAACAAVTWRQLGYWRDAGTIMRRALDVTERNWFAHYALGAWHEANNRFAEAEQQYRLSLVHKPHYALVHTHLGALLARQGQLDQAMPLLERAVALDPLHVNSRVNLGTALSQLGQHDTALLHYREAARISPEMADAHYNLGNTLRQLGRFEEALAPSRKAAQLRPGDASSQYNLGLILRARGENSQAIVHLLEAARLAPDDPDIQQEAGMALLQDGNGRDAERYLGAVVQSRPDSAPARNNLGTALAMQGRFGAAADHFAQAIAIDPGYVDAHFNLGLAQQRLGKSDEAKKQFQRVVELDPAHRAARNQLEHISD